MKIVIQRVAEATVEVEGRQVARIGRGLLVLVGVDVDDTPADAVYLAAKTAALRVMNDDDGVMNRSVVDVDGELLAVSQFTLLASTRRGNRPSYIRAAKRPLSTDLFDLYVAELERVAGRRVQQGVFGADMKVGLVNDGPVTIVIDSKENGK
ncbi:MAG: D-tyrosyl-tRNA(Tyr) deacylase [Muribaculaceae bacterium]|nr:D-tyrosyl-tRNA(Tyr) deacylase [Muribaculaceae bacterium]